MLAQAWRKQGTGSCLYATRRGDGARGPLPLLSFNVSAWGRA